MSLDEQISGISSSLREHLSLSLCECFSLMKLLYSYFFLILLGQFDSRPTRSTMSKVKNEKMQKKKKK